MSDPTEPRRTWKDTADPTFNPNRKRDLMTPEEHAAYRMRIMARRMARREYRAARFVAAARSLRELGSLRPRGTP
jgi:hypothetical protein